MTAPTLGLALAFNEWRPAHVSEETRRAVQREVDEWERYLQEVTARAIGWAVAWVNHKLLSEPLGDDFDIEVVESLSSATFNLPGATASYVMSSGQPKGEYFNKLVAQQQTWGLNLAKGLMTQQKAVLNAIITEGLKTGQSRRQIVETIMDTGPSAMMPEWRARLIAQTEAMRSYNRLALGSYGDTEVTHVKWMDGQVGACSSCLKLHGQIIPLPPGGSGMQSGANYFYDPLRGFAVQHPPLHPGCRCTIVSADQQEFLDQPDYDEVKYLPSGDVAGVQGGIGGKGTAPALSLPSKAPLDFDDFPEWLSGQGFSAVTSQIGLDNLFDEYLAKKYPGVKAMDIPSAQWHPMNQPGGVLDLPTLNKKLDDLFAAANKTYVPTTALDDIAAGIKAKFGDNAVIDADLLDKYFASLPANELTALANKMQMEGSLSLNGDELAKAINALKAPAKNLVDEIQGEYGKPIGDLAQALDAIDVLAAKHGWKMPYKDDPGFKKWVDDIAAEMGVAKSISSVLDELTKMPPKAPAGKALDDILPLVKNSGSFDDWFDALDDFATKKWGGNYGFNDDFKAWKAKLADEIGMPGAGLGEVIKNLPSMGLVKAPLDLIDEIKDFMKTSGLDLSDASVMSQAFLDFAAKKGMTAGELSTAIYANTATHGYVNWKAIADDLFAATPTAPGFPMPKASQAFLDWYHQHGQGKTGVAVFQAYAKHTGKTMNQVKADIEVEGYTVPQLTKLAPGAPLPAPVVVPPKKKPTAKATPPGVATPPKPLKPDPTFKVDSDVQPAAGQPPDYWEKATKTGPQMGSNTGGVYTGPDGQQWYLKQYTRSPLQASAELLSHKINDLLGIGRPQAAIIKMNGVEYYASKMMPGLKQLTPAEWAKIFKANPGMAEKIHIGASFTANWDVAGKTFDNLLWDDVAKKPVVIDAGGSFMFRAQGGAKNWNHIADDFDSLLNSNVNKNTAALFKGLYDTPESLAAGLRAAEHLKATLATINADAVRLGLPQVPNAALARLDDMIAKLKARTPVPFVERTGKAPFVPAPDLPKIMNAPAKLQPKSAASMTPEELRKRDSEVRDLSSSWSGSAQSEIAEIAKAKMMAQIFGGDPREHYIWEMKRKIEGAGNPFNRASAEKAYDRSVNLISDDTLAYIYQENQKLLRAKYPSGYITLYRGVGNRRQSEVNKIDESIRTNGIGQWTPAGLTSFSISESVAHGFGGDQYIKIKVPIEQVFLFTDYLDSHGGHHSREKEYIVIASPAGWTFTKEEWHSRVLRNFAEDNSGDGYVYNYHPSDDEEAEWKRWINRGKR